jgi:hypothetical protein
VKAVVVSVALLVQMSTLRNGRTREPAILLQLVE